MTLLPGRALKWVGICSIVIAPAVVVSQERPSSVKGSWSATAGSGQILQGTWTAQMDSAKPDVAVGSWTLLGPNHAIAAQGTWSAVKEEKLWAGSWQARRTGSDRLFSGRWRTQIAQSDTKSLADLLQHALRDQVSGTWTSGRLSGAWTVRAYP